MEALPTLDVLLTGPDLPGGLRPGDRVSPDPAERTLTALYAAGTGTSDRPTGAPWVRANMIASLDGAATGADDRSGSINGPADLRVFTTLRALADVVLVGAGTVRAEGYRAPRTDAPLVPARHDRGQPDHPSLAVVSASGDVPDAVLSDAPAPWVFTTSGAAHLERLRDRLPADRLHVHDDAVDLPRVLATLASAGLPLVLTEGGPSLLGSLLAADLVDELCLTTSPVLVGGGAPRVVRTTAWLEPPRTARPLHLLMADGVLLARWVLRRG